MDQKELDQISDVNCFAWIKVKRYKRPAGAIDYPFEYGKLESRHEKETQFLIAKCQELAKLARFGNWVTNMVAAVNESNKIKSAHEVSMSDSYIKVWEEKETKIKELEEKVKELQESLHLQIWINEAR